MSDLLLDVCELSKIFVRGKLLSRQRIAAVDRVSFQLDARRPEIFTIIGESGSGKTTLARMILNIETPSSGRVVLDGMDVAAIRSRSGRMAFLHKVQPIFQNPFESFNPMKRLDRCLFVTQRRLCAGVPQVSAEIAVDQALRKVGLSLGEVSHRYPHELSGGQLQRVAIARALLASPKLIVADEPVSMIDASLRISILNLFKALRDDLGISIVYITHDLATAYYVSNRIMIMQRGTVVETGDAKTVLTAPQHPYSRQLREAALLPQIADARVSASPGTTQVT